MVYKSIGGLYLSQNIQLVSYNDFCTELYKHIKEKKCIEVDSTLYSTLGLNNRIDVDSTLLQLYNKCGIDSLLNKYLDKEYEALSSNPQPIGFSGILLAKRQNSFYCTYFLHNRNVADTKSPYPIKRLEVIRWFNQKSMVFNQSLS